MLSGWKKLLQDVTESVSNLASNAVADATISASLTLPTIQLSNGTDAWHSLGTHQRSCLQAISDNQNKNHAANGQTSALLASVCSKLQARDLLVGNLQQDIDFVSESKSSLPTLASEIAIMSQELISLTNFLAAFREALTSRTVARLKNDADVELLLAQKNSHARITAASRARDLNLNKSIHAVRPPLPVPSASVPSNAPSLIVADAEGAARPGPESQLEHLSGAAGNAPEAVLAPKADEGTGNDVVIDFEELLEGDNVCSKLPEDASAGQ